MRAATAPSPSTATGRTTGVDHLQPAAELVVEEVRRVVDLQLVVVAVDAVGQAAEVVGVLHGLADALVRIDHLLDAVPGS